MQSTAQSKVRALTRAATPASEAELLELARSVSAARLERLIRAWKTLDRSEEQAVERLRHRSRTFSVFPDGEGMYVVKGRLPPEAAVALMRAVEAASDALFAASADADGEAEEIEPAQRRADAVGLLAERALEVGFGRDAPLSGSRAERYQVLRHVDRQTLSKSGEPGRSELEDGTRVTAETARRLSCDASVVEVRRGPPRPQGEPDTPADEGAAADADQTDGARRGGPSTDAPILDVGRRARTIPTPIRRALEARDRGCRFPGCGLRFTEGHHITHWADGGETSLDNLVLLCRRHHRRVHEDGFRVYSDVSGQVVFFTPEGKALFEAPEPPQPGPDPASDLIRGNRERGVVPDWRTGEPRYRSDADVPWKIEAAALEALDPWEEEEEEEEVPPTAITAEIEGACRAAGG